MHLLTLSVPSTFPFDNRLVEKIGEIIDVPVGFQNDIAAATAVTPIGAAFRDKLLPAETDATAATISSLSEDFDPIDKHYPTIRERLYTSKQSFKDVLTVRLATR